MTEATPREEQSENEKERVTSVMPVEIAGSIDRFTNCHGLSRSEATLELVQAGLGDSRIQEEVWQVKRAEAIGLLTRSDVTSFELRVQVSDSSKTVQAERGVNDD